MDQNKQVQESSEGEERVIIKNEDAEDFEEDETGRDGEYHVEKIIDVKECHGQKYYFVKWEGYTDSDSTWEPENNLRNVYWMLEDFEKEQDQKKIWKPVDENEVEKKTPKPDAQVERRISRSQRPKIGFSSDDGEENIVKKVKMEIKNTKEGMSSNKAVSKTNSGESEDEVNSSENSEARVSEKTEKTEVGNKKLRKSAGSLKTKDKPKSILRTTQGEDSKEFIFLVEWEERNDGVMPENSTVSNKDLRKYNPNFLLDYYESKITTYPKKKLAAERREKSMTGQKDLKSNWLDSNDKENTEEEKIERTKSLPSKTKKQKGMLTERNPQNQSSKELDKNEENSEEIARGMGLESLDGFGNNML